MIRAIRFALRNAHYREVKWMPLGQIQRIFFAPERDRNILYLFVILPFRRLAFLFLDLIEMNFAHVEFLSLDYPPALSTAKVRLPLRSR